MTTEDDPDNDPMMRSMRSVWLGMRDEDPPARGMAELIAAARSQADVMRPKESWWRRSMAMLVRPPMLAAATVVLVVGGAVALSKRGVEQASPAAVNSELRDRAQNEAAPMPRQAPLEAQRPGLAGSNAVRTPPVREVRPQVHRPDKATEDVMSAFGKDAVNGPTGAGSAAPPPPSPTPKNDADKGGDNGRVSAGDSLRIKSPEPKPEMDRSEETASGTSKQQGQAQTVSTDQLVKQTEAAADRKDCPAVRATSARIKKTAPAVYKSRVANQPAIARCLK